MMADPDGYEVKRLGESGAGMSPAERALSVARECWNAGDLDGYLGLYDERIRLHGYSPAPMTKTEVRGFYEQIFRAFGTPPLEFHETLWERDTCAIRFTMTGRHVDEFMGVAPTDLPITLPGITILHFEGEQVIERFSQADMLGLLIQIRAVPAP
jgi:predicted ester cyclase